MKAKDRDTRIRELFEEDLVLLQKKGHDYSGEKDCLRNFRDFGAYGILVRLSDKIARLRNLFANRDAKVGDESLLDTVADIRNYGYLFEVVFKEEEKEKPGANPFMGET